MNKTPQKNLVILDIGSHKLEEIQTLFSPFLRQLLIYIKWFIKLVLKILLKFDKPSLNELKKQAKVIDFFFLRRRRYNVTIISIEPNPNVILPHLNKLSKRLKICYVPAAIIGHDSSSDFEVKTLFVYGNSLSNSLYKKNRKMDVDQNNICLSLKLSKIWDGLISLGLVEPDSEIILRMNCEGAELGVIKECEHNNLDVKLLIGSIGDIRKIHGEKQDKEANQIMHRLGYNYYYFKGDDPYTWYDIIQPWEIHTSKFIR